MKPLAVLAVLVCVVLPRPLPAAPAAADPHPSLLADVRNGDLDAVRRSIEQGADVKARDDRGNTALHLAALNMDADAVARLLKAGANPNATNTWGDTPLIYSAGSLEKVRLLLENGAEVNARAKSGATALSAAGAFRDSFRVVRFLLDHGATPDSKQPVEVLSSVLGNDVETVKLLLARGALASTDSPDFFQSPLVSAALSGNEPIAQLLIKSAGPPGASATALNTAVHWAGFGQKAPAARAFVLAGADLHTPFMFGALPPLHWAAYNEQDDPGLVRLLLEKGADVNAENEAGETALDWADKRGNRRCIAALTDAGGKPGKRRAKSKRVPDRAVPTSAVARQQMLRTSVERALALMQRSSDAFLDSGLAKAQNCVSCHHQTMASMASELAFGRGIRPDAASLRRTLDATLRALEPEIARCYEGVAPEPNPAIGCGYMLMQLAALGHRADAVTDALVWQMAAYQKSDGSWPWTATRPPLEHGQIKATALALKSLRTYPLPSRKAEFERRVRRAAAWLRDAKPESPTELAFQLLGLGWAGEKPDATKPFTDAVLAAQKPDGGWASLKNLESDAWMTGLNLVALREAGGVDVAGPAYRRGVDFLLRTQFDDGSWWVRSRTIPVQPHFDSRFPHGRDQFISAAGTGWATMALLLTLDPVPQPSPLAAQMAAVPAAPVAPAVAAAREPRPNATAATLSFKRDIAPILGRSCTDCHGEDTGKGSFNAETLAGLMKGGQSGNPAVIPGHAETSPLIRFVRDGVEDLEMPPLAKRPKYSPLNKSDIETLSRWIDQGVPE